MRLEDPDKVVVIARYYDEAGKLTDAGIADEGGVCRTPYAASLIEEHLVRLGWMRLEQRSSIKRLNSGHITFSLFYCPDFVGRLAPPLERRPDGTVRTRHHLC